MPSVPAHWCLVYWEPWAGLGAFGCIRGALPNNVNVGVRRIEGFRRLCFWLGDKRMTRIHRSAAPSLDLGSQVPLTPNQPVVGSVAATSPATTPYEVTGDVNWTQTLGMQATATVTQGDTTLEVRPTGRKVEVLVDPNDPLHEIHRIVETFELVRTTEQEIQTALDSLCALQADEILLMMDPLPKTPAAP